MECTVYGSPSVSTFVLSVLLTVGIFVSYVPQHLRIIHRKTTEGLSPIFLLLGSTSGCSAFLNLLLLTSDARDCCMVQLSKFQCLNSQLGLIQVGVQFISYSLILVLLVIYTRNSITQRVKDYNEMFKVFELFLIYAVINAFITIYILLRDQHHLKPFAHYSGIISSILSGVQYFPQLYTTYRLKHPGSLSIGMMLMQTPGGFLWTLTLFLAPNSNWSSWLPYLTAAILQGVLLCMCIYYNLTRDVLLLESEVTEEIVHENERSPLL